MLVDEGSSGYTFIVLTQGSASVSSGGAALGELGRGDLFGEIAIVERRRRSATVTATAPVKVLMMFGWDFRGLQEAQPEIAARIADAMAQRLAADAGPA